ncbi:MAG: hypothetical protein J0M18_01555 [Ignavibacteria bacterium]|jgi:hypothetical protein|nr:hypothetical protein [Ignavibacteria bacterium]
MKKLILTLFAFSLITAVGCKVDVKTGDDANNDKKTETGKEQSNSSDNKSSGEAPKDNGNSGSNDLGLTSGIPSNYPTDVPQPKDSKCLGSLNSSEGTVVTFESTQSVKDILEYYKAEMKKNGYEVGEGGEVLMSDKGGIVGWKKGAKEVGLMLGVNDDKKNTSIVITYK